MASSSAVPDPRAVAAIGMVTPPDWWDLPLDPATRTDKIAELVSRWAAKSPELAHRAREVTDLLFQLSEDATSGGAVFSSQMGILSATGSLAANILVTAQPLRSTADLLTEVRQQVDPAAVINLQAPEVTTVDLTHAGRAVRRYARQVVELAAAGGPVEGVVVQYFIPVPRSESVALVTCTAPGGGDSRSAVELLDAVVGSFRFFNHDDEPIEA
ncbi:MAG TPA: hypothetical protein VG184_12245 [Acidimicrobiales bacterium]|nr:hypothetical protein [Acidimicrobiales bacterium]